MWLFEQDGFDNALRISHVVVGVMWIGLLWFFNFVQVPAYAEMEAAARNNALDKLTWRALWWFRWAAMATVVFGILIVAVWPDKYDADFWQTSGGLTLLLGIIMGLVMAGNVWMVIWPNQQTVIGNARNVQAGGEANPEAAAAGRRSGMASRQNTIFSLPLLVFMVGVTHFYGGNSHFESELSGGTWVIYFLIGVIIIAVLELNALGKVSGTGSGGLNVIYETHKNAMYTGFALIVFFYLLAEIMLQA
jgi:uncharacterized membrane protein